MQNQKQRPDMSDTQRRGGQQQKSQPDADRGMSEDKDIDNEYQR